MPPLRTRQLNSLLEKNRGLITSLEKLFNPGNLPPSRAFPSDTGRVRIFREILSTRWVSESYDGYSNLASATSRRLLTERDLFELGESVARSAPRNGSSWREYLGLLADQGKLEEALATVEAEIATAKKGILEIVLRVEKCQILKVMGNAEAVAKMETELSREKLELPREYKSIRRDLERR